MAHQVGWFEIRGQDPAKLRGFYGELFGWKAQLDPSGVYAEISSLDAGIGGGIAPAQDPFILVLNHNTKLEALLLPAFFLHARQGKALHFIADWNFKLVPGVAGIYRAGDVITLDRKPARPRWLVTEPGMGYRYQPRDETVG